MKRHYEDWDRAAGKAVVVPGTVGRAMECLRDWSLKGLQRAAIFLSQGLIFAAMTGLVNVNGQVVISEFLADNSKGPGFELRDEDNDASDWIELRNVSTNTINLAGWYLTDDPGFLPKWRFPTKLLDSGLSLVVFASGKNRSTGTLHTNFELPDEEGFLALVAPDGVTVMQEFSNYPKQRRKASFGLPLGHWDAPNYLAPTPDAANADIFHGVMVSEIMYHPAAPPAGSAYAAEDFQFIEFSSAVANIQNVSVTLEGSVTYSGSMTIDPAQPSIIVANLLAFRTRYGTQIPVAGQFIGRLPRNAGAFTVRVGDNSAWVNYDDRWDPATDGLGFSLVNRNLSSPLAYTASGWRPSTAPGGSPGQPDPPFLVSEGVVVNEILAHSEPPFEDAVELFNTRTNDIDISGWFLSDRLDTPKKFRVPEGTIIPAGSFLAFDEHSFNPPFVDETNRFELRGGGEGIYLLSADLSGNLTGYAHGFEFEAADENVSIGREMSSIGQEIFVPQETMSFFATNGLARVGPVVISELMAAPPSAYRNISVANGFDEFVELHNLTTEPIRLGGAPDGSGTRWRLRDGIDFNFPTNAVVPSNGFIMVVGFDPQDEDALRSFREHYRIPEDVSVFGPWAGKLSNTDDRVDLVYVRPDYGESWREEEICVDRVHYSRSVPWSFIWSGGGASMQRIDSRGYGNDPANWRATAPTPGQPTRTGPAPTIVSSTADQKLGAGMNLTLVVEATPAEALGYQWFYSPVPTPFGLAPSERIFDGYLLYQATDSRLPLLNLHPWHSGRYTCVVFGPGGAATTSILLEVTNAPTARPTPSATVLRPASSLVTSNGQLTLVGSAASETDVAGVVVWVNKSGGASAHLAHGTSNWTATVSLGAGINEFSVSAFDSAGISGAPQSLSVEYRVESPIHFTSVGNGTITGLTNGQTLLIGHTYQLKASPLRGQVFLDWRLPGGQLFSYDAVLEFTMLSNLNVTATFIPSPFPAAAGTYDGLFYQDALGRPENSGSLSLEVGRSGKFAGSLHTLLGRKKFKGTLDPRLMAPISVEVAPGSNYILNVQLGGTNGSMAGAVFNLVNQNWSELQGFRRPHQSARPSPGSFDLNFLDGWSTNVPPPSVGSGGLTVRRTGFARVVGAFAGSVRLDRRAPVSADGRLLYYAIDTSRFSPPRATFGWLHLNVTGAPDNPAVWGTLYSGPASVQNSRPQRVTIRGTAAPP